MLKSIAGAAAAAIALTTIVAVPVTAVEPVAAVSDAVSQPQADLNVRVSNDPATEFWGRARPTAPGKVKDVEIVPGRVNAKNVTITNAPAVGDITGTAVLHVGKRVVNTSFTWTDGCNWAVNLTRNSSPGKPRSKTAINLDKVSGTITATDCQRTLDLVVHGYKIGDKKAKIKLAATPRGFEGSKTFSTLTVGDTQYANVTVTISSSRKYAQLSGTIKTNLGKFTADSKITKVGSVYTQSLSITGVDLKVEKGGTRFDSFTYSTTATYSANSCASFTNSFGGDFYMKNKSYSIQDARMTIDCGKVTVFKFKITVSHKEPATGIVKRGTLAMAWTDKPGTAQDLLDPSLGDSGGQIGSLQYKKGLFGYVDLSESRRFSKKYKGRTFSRSVTMGIVFGVAIYVPQNRSSWNAMIGAGGYFDADRVSGSFGCVYQHSDSDDFGCAGQLRLNPSWAGVYRAQWGDI